MKPNTPPHFRCIACTKVYRWRPERAGRKVLCVCGLIMRCAKTPDGKPIAIGHKPPVIKPSEARVHAAVGENAVVNLENLDKFEGIEESVTMNLNTSDVIPPSDLPTDLDLKLDLDIGDKLQPLIDESALAQARPEAPAARPEAPVARPEAPAPVINRPEAPTPIIKPGSAAGLRPAAPATAIHAPVAPDVCPHCKGKVRVGAVLCIQCGSPLKPPTEPATSTQAATVTAPQGAGSGFFAKMLKAVVKPKDPTLPNT